MVVIGIFVLFIPTIVLTDYQLLTDSSTIVRKDLPNHCIYLWLVANAMIGLLLIGK